MSRRTKARDQKDQWKELADVLTDNFLNSILCLYRVHGITAHFNKFELHRGILNAISPFGELEGLNMLSNDGMNYQFYSEASGKRLNRNMNPGVYPEQYGRKKTANQANRAKESKKSIEYPKISNTISKVQQKSQYNDSLNQSFRSDEKLSQNYGYVQSRNYQQQIEDHEEDDLQSKSEEEEMMPPLYSVKPKDEARYMLSRDQEMMLGQWIFEKVNQQYPIKKTQIKALAKRLANQSSNNARASWAKNYLSKNQTIEGVLNQKIASVCAFLAVSTDVTGMDQNGRQDLNQYEKVSEVNEGEISSYQNLNYYKEQAEEQ